MYNLRLPRVIYTYKGPGKTLAPRISEYGIITMGLVGNARYGCGGDITGGLLAISGGLTEPVFDVFDLVVGLDGAAVDL